MKVVSKTKAVALVAATVIASMTAPAQAGIFGASETREWNVCEWEQLPNSVVERITKRGDFDDILRRMFDACPDSALGLTDRPTASISDSGGFGNRQGEADGSPGNSSNRGGGSSGGGGSSTSSGGGGTGGGLPG